MFNYNTEDVKLDEVYYIINHFSNDFHIFTGMYIVPGGIFLSHLGRFSSCTGGKRRKKEEKGEKGMKNKKRKEKRKKEEKGIKGDKKGRKRNE